MPSSGYFPWIRRVYHVAGDERVWSAVNVLPIRAIQIPLAEVIKEA